MKRNCWRRQRRKTYVLNRDTMSRMDKNRRKNSMMFRTKDIICSIDNVQMDDSWKSDHFSLVTTYGRERQKEDETIRSEGVKARKEKREKRIRFNGGTRTAKLWTKRRSA